MKCKKLRQVLATFSQFLSWTPAAVVLHDHTISSSVLFSKFQRHETYFQLKVVLAGIAGFLITFAITAYFPQRPGYDLPWHNDIPLYSSVVAAFHLVLLMIALLKQHLHKLVIFRKPWVLSAVSYLVLVPVISGITFTSTDRLFNARLYVMSSSLLCIVATLYYQQSFPVSAFVWCTVLANCTINLIKNSNAEEVSLSTIYTYC